MSSCRMAETTRRPSPRGRINQVPARRRQDQGVLVASEVGDDDTGRCLRSRHRACEHRLRLVGEATPAVVREHNHRDGMDTSLLLNREQNVGMPVAVDPRSLGGRSPRRAQRGPRPSAQTGRRKEASLPRPPSSAVVVSAHGTLAPRERCAPRVRLAIPWCRRVSSRSCRWLARARRTRRLRGNAIEAADSPAQRAGLSARLHALVHDPDALQRKGGPLRAAPRGSGLRRPRLAPGSCSCPSNQRPPA